MHGKKELKSPLHTQTTPIENTHDGGQARGKGAQVGTHISLQSSTTKLTNSKVFNLPEDLEVTRPVSCTSSPGHLKTDAGLQHTVQRQTRKFKTHHQHHCLSTEKYFSSGIR